MRRREFLLYSGVGLAHTLTSCRSTAVADGPADVVATLIEQNDARVPELLARQQRDPEHAWFGGIADRYGIHTAGGTVGFVRDLAAAYTAPGRYRGSAALLGPMRDAARCLRAMQHGDGTIDLHTTNFHSPPDTGFVLEHACTAAAVLSSHGEAAAAGAELREFIVGGANALAVGGIHTPNHRWVVCMALARANALFPDPRYVARIDEWLAEGIDIDGDGQFTERSSSIYSPITDRCLLTVARLLDRPELLEPVRRNLEMTLFYVHADGEVATEGSRRQDRYRRGSLAPYYLPYRRLAQLDDDGRFAAMTRWIERTSLDRLTGNLIAFLEQPELRAPMPAPAVLPTDYERAFTHSGLVRIRRGDVSATILADNPTLFSFHHRSAAVVVRFASAFFGKGQFAGDAVEKIDGAHVLRQELVGPYYQPLPAEHRRADGNWSRMDRSLRPQSEVQRLRSTVTIREDGGAFTLTIAIDGTDRVPVAVELGFRPGGALEGIETADGVQLLADGDGRYRFDGADIRFGPGRVEHRWTQLRGALPGLPNSVYLTGFTPFRHQLRIGV